MFLPACRPPCPRVSPGFRIPLHPTFAYSSSLFSDLIHVIVNLREVLENCLGEHPCPRTLDRYMPQVKRVVYDLLVGLRNKQAPYWESVYASQRRKASTLELNRQST